MNLEPEETRLEGNWIYADGKPNVDPTCRRIEFLIAHQLKKIVDSPEYGGWETLFRDPVDGRYWERTYPHGEMQGGGPPCLTVLPADIARKKYRLR